MPSPVPTPVAAALGLVPTVLDGVRRLPGRAVALPVVAVSSALAGLDLARREYDDLAARGQRLIARLRGTSFDELEDRVEDRLQGTPLARPYDAVEDALEDAGEAVARTASKAAQTARARVQRGAGTTARTADDAAGTVSDLSEKAAQKAGRATGAAAGTATEAAGKAADTAGKAAKKAGKAAGKAAGTTERAAGTAADTTEKAAGKAAAKSQKAAAKTEKAAGKAAGKAEKAGTAAEGAVPADEQPKGAPTPKAERPDDTPVDTAASAEVVQTVERVAEQTRAPVVVEHDDLPLPDYDHMTLGSLRGRLRSLTVEQLVQLREYEKAHADRLPVVTMLDNRIAKVASDSGTQPSGVPSDRPAAGQGSSRGGSKVSPATGGPAQNPPSQGVPTNPAQPRTTGSPGTNPTSNA